MLPFITTTPTATINPPPSGSRALPEYARVRLRCALPAVGLKAGALGTVVHVYEGGAGYEVEFAGGRKHPAAATVEPEDLEALTEADEWA